MIANSKLNELMGEFTGMQPRLEITEHHLEEIKFHGINADDKELDRCLDLFFEGIRISDEMERKCCNAENLQIDLQKQSETLKKIEDSLAREDLSFNPK